MDSDVSDDELKRIFTSLYNNFCSIFGSPTFSDEFINHLKLIDVPVHTPCCKRVVDAWKCETCSVQYNGKICVDCFEKSNAKHQGHKIIFMTETGGCCNCGDPYIIRNEGACDEHKSAIEGDEAIQDYLDRCFKPEQQSSIREILDMIFSLMSSYLGKYQGEDCTKYKTEILDKFLNFIFKISSNTAMMFIVTENLCKTYRSNVKHRCFYIENNKIKSTKEGEGAHLCKCPFIRIILEHWSSDLKELHYTYEFLKNFKLKKVYAMSILSLYKTLYLKKYDTFEGIAFQVFDMKTAGVIANSTEFIEHVFNEFYKVIADNKDFKLNKPRKEISDFMFLFQIIFSNLIYPNTYKKLGENIKLFKIVINILELLQYSNRFKKSGEEIPLNDYNWYYEFYMLSLFGMLCACADYSNKKFVNEIFDYFSQKIREHYKEVTPLSYSYTMHLSLYRGFSIFVIRYMYTYSVKNNCDLLSSLRLILRNIPKFEKVCEIIIKDELKFIGFLASVKAGEWILIDDVKNYNFDYFTTKVPRLMDQSLMKLMLCLEENAKYFQFHKMLKYATYGYSSDYFIDNIINIDNTNRNFTFYSINERDYTITAEIIRLVLAIVRNRISIFETFHIVYYKLAKNKNKLDVCEKILEYEKENIIAKTRQLLINRILSYDNSAQFSEFDNNCYADYLEPILSKEEFKKLVMSLTTKTVLLNQEVRYTIKDDFLSQCDIGLIPYIQRATQAENYLLEFKKNKVNILNTFNIPPFDIENDLDLESNVHFFVPNITSKNSNSNFFRLIRIQENVRNNIDFIREFLVSLVEKPMYKDITKYFLNLFAKMLLVFTDITYKNNRFKDVTLDSYVIVNALKPYDDTYKDVILFLKTNIEALYGMAKEVQKEETTSEDKKNKKKQLMDKYKKKFKKKNEDIKNKFIDQNAIEEKEQIESCVICKNEIDFNDKENISGKLCMALTDSLIWKTRDIKAYKIYKKYNKTPFKYKDYISKFVTKSTVLEKMNTRILTCNHYAHYKCYEKYQKNITKKDLQCPLCKTKINLFLPDIIHIKSEGKKNDLTFAQLERWLGDFAKSEIYSEIDKVSEKSLCEYFQSINAIINIQMKESEDIEKNAEKVYGIIIRNFNALSVLVHNIDDKEIQKQIENFSNLLLTLRSVIIQSKSGSNLRNFLMNYIVMKDQILKEGEFDDVDKIFDSILLFMTLFTEDAEFDEIANLQGILAMFLPYYAFNIYLKNLYCENGLARSDKFDAGLSVKKIYNFFRNELSNDINADIENTITELLTKIKIAKQISHFINNNFAPINTDYSLQSLLSEFHIDVNRPLPAVFISFDFLKEIPSFLSREDSFINRTYYDTTLSSLSDSFTASQFTLLPSFLLHSCLPPSIDLISLPSSLIDFLIPFQKRGCHYCKKLDTHCLVCMTCGRKLCNSFDCLYKKQEKYSCFYHHAKYCTGLNSLYFIPKGGTMRFCSFNFFSERLIAYKNSFGDKVENDEVTNDFALDEEEMRKALKRFILFKHIESSKEVNEWEWVEAFFKPREEFEDFDCDDEYEYKDI